MGAAGTAPFSHSAGIFFIPNTALRIPAKNFGLFSTTIFICTLLSRQHFSRNIAEMISTAATVKSSTLSEKKEIHISAARNAATASSTPVPQFLRRLRGLLMLSPPVVSLPYIIPPEGFWLLFRGFLTWLDSQESRFTTLHLWQRKDRADIPGAVRS